MNKPINKDKAHPDIGKQKFRVRNHYTCWVEYDVVANSKEEAEDFYKVHQTKPFYNDLCNYLSSGPILVMVLEGEEAVSINRQIMGATDPLKAKEGTLRKMYGLSIDKNSVHGSDSAENAKNEISFFFKK